MSPDSCGDLYISRLMNGLSLAGSRPVLRSRGQDVTADAFRRMIFRYARALEETGIGRDSLVALFAPNEPEALAIRYGANLLGAPAAYLSAPAQPDRRRVLVDEMAPSLLVVFAETAGLVPDGLAVPVASVGAACPQASIRLDERAAAQPDEPVANKACAEDPAVVISSDGTTDVPKGSWHDFAAYTAMVSMPSPPDRRQLINGPLAYLSQVVTDMTLLGGGCVVLENRYDPAQTLETIEREEITDLFLVEPQLFEVMDHADVGRRDLRSLRTITHIGASAPPVLRRRARERLGAVIAHSYGAGEMGIVSMLAGDERDPRPPERFSCAGRIRPGVEVRFRRPNGTLAVAGQTGSIEVRSPAMAKGYRNRPALQAEAFRDGWYRSDDFGTLDARGDLHILGRTADIAWLDGVMVSPTLIENALCRLPAVRYAVVMANRQAGNWIAAVVPWPGGAIDRAACRRAVATAFSPAAAARLLVVPVARMPMTEQGEPDRTAIRQLASPPH